LLFGAKGRYRSARATRTHTVDAPLAGEANRRFVDWRFAQGNPGMGIIGKPGPPAREDFYQDYEATEEVVNLWHEWSDLWREERWGVGGELLRCVVAAGRGAPLWIYERTFSVPRNVYSNLGKKAIVQHGVDLNHNGRYDFKAAGRSELDSSLPQEATIPANCGVINPIAR
jgi:hypothetical protein